MKEIRFCDNAEIDLTIKLCIENNLGVEVQAFHDPFLKLNLGIKMQGIRQKTQYVIEISLF